jgi:5-aminolevulinate synthase
MESLLRQANQVCPFLARTSPSTLKLLAASVSTSRGYKMSGLQAAASQCPVLGRALQVQTQKREYVSSSKPREMCPSGSSWAESVSLEEAHRAAGVSDLSQGIGPRSRTEVDVVGVCPHAEMARKAHGLDLSPPKKFDYEAFYANELDRKHKDKSYRYFNNINRVCPA